MASYEATLREGKKLARRQDKETSAVEMLFLHFSGLKPTELYLKFNEEMPEAAIAQFMDGLDRYICHDCPVQYIIGETLFFGYPITVNESVLIPRFETEELVEKVLELADGLFPFQPVKILDLCTGSGCIAIALKKELPNAIVFASDISQEALAVAKKNATELQADISFFQGDLFESLQGETFDIIVANPPYIPETEKVAKIILDYEPHLALFGGRDGLDFYDRILQEAPKYLKHPGFMAFEHAYHAASKIRGWGQKAFPSAKIYTEQDMQGKDRMTFIIFQ
ncbi:MAG: peptide chain release factor N(5)-glutamine methyltransferase [Candidatus Izemoplasmatales bacterium]